MFTSLLFCWAVCGILTNRHTITIRTFNNRRNQPVYYIDIESDIAKWVQTVITI